MTFTISKKDFIYGAVILLIAFGLTVSLLGSNVWHRNAPTDVKSYESSEQATDSTGETIPQLDIKSTSVGTGIQHLTCNGQVYFSGLPTTHTYNSNSNYNLNFMTPGTNFQDINGDGLPDYTWSYSNLSGSDEELESLTYGCVYLNNGHGWDRAYLCYARTRANLNTGVTSIADYKGDCAAGSPGVNEEPAEGSNQ